MDKFNGQARDFADTLIEEMSLGPVKMELAKEQPEAGLVARVIVTRANGSQYVYEVY